MERMKCQYRQALNFGRATTPCASDATCYAGNLVSSPLTYCDEHLPYAVTVTGAIVAPLDDVHASGLPAAQYLADAALLMRQNAGLDGGRMGADDWLTKPEPVRRLEASAPSLQKRG